MKMAAIVLVGVLCCGVAEGAHFKSPDGYSFDYPDTWTVISKDQQQEALRVAAQRGVKLPQVDLSRVSCMVMDLNLGPSQFGANANMVVARDNLVAKESNIPKMRESLTKELTGAGMPPSNLEIRIDKVGGRDAFRATWRTAVPGIGRSIRQSATIVPAGSKVYILSCAADLNDFSLHEESFEQIISSLQVEASSTLWGNSGPVGIFSGLVGGLIAAVLVRRKKKNAAQPATAAAGIPVFPGNPLPAGWPDGQALPPGVGVSPVEGGPAQPAEAVSELVQPPAIPLSESPPMPSLPDTAPETIIVTCPSCGGQFRARPALSGRRCRCPKCQGPIDVP